MDNSTSNVSTSYTGERKGDSDTYRTALIKSSGASSRRGVAGRFNLDVPTTLLQRAASMEDGMTAQMSDDLVAQVSGWLKSNSMLQSFTDEQVKAICLHMSRLELSDGQEVFAAGSTIDSLGVVVQGSLQLGLEAPVTDGFVWGAAALFSTKQAEATLVSRGDSVVWTINRLLFQAVLIKQAQSVDSKRSKILKSIPMLAPLSPAQQQRVAQAMRVVKFGANSHIIRQGEIGNTMYFIEKGSVVVMQKNRGEAEAKEVNRHGAGAFVGEAALINEGVDGGIRNADVIADRPTICYALKREDFLELLGPMQDLIARKSRARVLKGVDLFAPLSDGEREEIAQLMTRQTYARSSNIITQGEQGNEFYIIESGEVKFTRVPDEGGAPEDIGRFFQNQFFGEVSLLTAAPRRATAVADSQEVVCQILSGQTLREMLGEEMMRQLGRAKQLRVASSSAEKRAEMVSVSDLNGIRLLGEGSYGKVTLVRHGPTGQTFALKQIKKSHVKKMNQESHIRTERDVLAAVNHPFVCNLVRTFKNAHSVYFLMEAVLGGELYNHLQKSEKFNPATARFYAAQVAACFEHLHTRDIIFRDLKPENLLIASDGYLKLVDFGLAKHVTSGKTYTLCGTPAYASPEVYASVGHDKGVDWWTLGVLVHELLAGYTPFYGKEPNEIYGEICRYAKHYPRVAFPQHFPAEASALLMGLLAPKPSKRLGNGSGGARDVKTHPYFAGLDWKLLLSKKIQPEHIPAIQDSFDSSNFKKRNKDFEQTIAEDNGADHEDWCADF